MRQHAEEVAIGNGAIARRYRLGLAPRADHSHAQYLEKGCNVPADGTQAHDHGTLPLEVTRRALSQPRLPDMSTLGVGQQRKASIEGDQRAQDTVRHGHGRRARGRRYLDAALAQFPIDRPLRTGGMDLQPFELRRLAQHGLEATQLGRIVVLARVARDFARHERDVGLTRPVRGERILGGDEGESIGRHGFENARCPGPVRKSRKQEFHGA